MKKYFLLFAILASTLEADINFSGDARLRPRLDVKDNGDGSSTSDFYFLYRARVNLKADIGEGWFFSSKLAVNSASGMSQMGKDGGSAPGITSSYRPSASFSEAYFGYADDSCGFWSGAFPLKYNSSLDLHFYSGAYGLDNLVDIPFAVFSNSSVTGFAGYNTVLSQKFNWFLSVDKNLVEVESFSDDQDDVKKNDNYTLGLDLTVDAGPVSLTPRALVSFGGAKGELSPATYGADLKLPELAGFATGLSYYMSALGSDGDAGSYQADHARFSVSGPVGKGKLKLFYDMASSKSFDLDETNKLSFVWLAYSHTLYKGESGAVTVSPTYRLQRGELNPMDCCQDGDYSRSKFEVTVQMKFK
ncbi:MAG: hypothetical protein CBD58_03865 [bacterium TMED198]|nr:MAG: hypothetical protein CBD58_03865 [bacterium TMED198]|tara:strand:+ start:34 stop:1113 length:1080 start_codon:yes stop_codon:yes gene_type:complete